MADDITLLAMAVFTHLDREQIIAFLDHYDLGELDRYEGIEQGVSNTNYHLFTDKGRYILTLFEPHRVKEEELDFFLSYASHMAVNGVPSASAVEDQQGRKYSMLADRPAAIMSFCQGNHPEELNADLCGKAGVLLAQMHVACKDFAHISPNHYGPQKWQQWSDDLGNQLNDLSFGLTDAIRGEISDLKALWPKDLPHGAVHADFFPDNVFFNADGDVSGVIDFHFACTDMFAYDLAIALNAWCFDEHHNFVEGRYNALLNGYEVVRPLSEDEKNAMNCLLRGAALRFVLSRCDELLSYKEGDMMKPHDPQAFIKRLEFFQEKCAA